MLKQTIRGYIQDTENHIAKLKISQNALVAINRLPISLLTRIILLATSWNKLEGKHPYISYTWVCHHWRCVVIQHPDFWTSLQFKPNSESDPISPFVRELLDRSKKAKLDIRLKIDSTSYLPTLRDFFAEESNRIRTLWIHVDLSNPIKSIFSDSQFPSLRKVICHCGNIKTGCNGLRALLPSFVASENLETLECSMWHVDTTHQLEPVFNHLQTLTIGAISSDAVLRSVLDVLHNNTRLRALRLLLHPSFLPSNLSSQTTLHEVRFLGVNISLLNVIQAPKLSGLNILCDSPLTFDNPIMAGFDFSSIKYLHILKWQGRYSILGLKRPIHPTSVFSKSSDLLKKIRFAQEVQDVADALDDALDTWPPDYFHILLPSEATLGPTLDALSSIFSRLTNLLELCLMVNVVILRDRENCFSELLAQVPSLETLIILYGLGVTDVIRALSNTSLCPRLKHLSYVTGYSYDSIPERCKPKITAKVGRQLAECLQLRQEAHGSNKLNYIAFGNFPPFPDICLKELQKLGTTVSTEEDVDLTGWTRLLAGMDYEDYIEVSGPSESLEG